MTKSTHSYFMYFWHLSLSNHNQSVLWKRTKHIMYIYIIIMWPCKIKRMYCKYIYCALNYALLQNDIRKLSTLTESKILLSKCTGTQILSEKVADKKSFTDIVFFPFFSCERQRTQAYPNVSVEGGTGWGRVG